MNGLLGVRNIKTLLYNIVISLFHYEAESSVTLHKCLHRYVMTILKLSLKNHKEHFFRIIYKIHSFIHSVILYFSDVPKLHV